MSVDMTSPENEDNLKDTSLNPNERDLIEDLILQNKTLDALIKGLTEDIETFKREGDHTKADIVRFTMQLNIMKDKKSRNLAAINEIIKTHKHN